MLSYTENIPIILKAVAESGAKTILDVGAGMGKYGLLIREQHLSMQAEAGSLYPIDKLFIDACEDTPYFTKRPAVKAIYNKVITESYFGILGKARYYQLVLLIDIIEHYKKESIMVALKLLPRTQILISTPKQVTMYKKHYYGDRRHHVTQWTDAEIQEVFCGRTIIQYQSDLSYILRIV